MQPLQATIIHLITADVSSEQVELLHRAIRQRDLAVRQVVVQLGSGEMPTLGGSRPTRVHTPLNCGWLAAGALRAALRRAHAPDDGNRVVLHAWSSDALCWCQGRIIDGAALLVSVASDADAARVLRRSAAAGASVRTAFACGHPAVRQRLLGLGVPQRRCHLLDPPIAGDRIDAADRPATRSRLSLEEGHTAVLALPPIRRHTGSLTAAWGALLLEKVRHDVRFVVPADGRERTRIERLVRACRHEWMVRAAPRALDLPDLIAAADLCVYLPLRPAPLGSVAAALAAGRACLTTSSIRAALGAHAPIWCCAPNDPEAAARGMLRALQECGDQREQLSAARADARRRFAVQHAVAQLRGAYKALLQD